MLADSHKERSEGFHTWTDDEIEVFRAKFPTGTKARLALEIFLGTGAGAAGRRGGSPGRIYAALASSIAEGRPARKLTCRSWPSWRRNWRTLSPDQMMLLAHGERAKAYSATPLGNWFRGRCREAGLPLCTSHGLRKAVPGVWPSRCDRMGGDGLPRASDRQGGEPLYRSGESSMLTTRGMARLSTKPEQILSNLPSKLDKEGG